MEITPRIRIKYDPEPWKRPGGPVTFEDLDPGDRDLVNNGCEWNQQYAAILVLDQLPLNILDIQGQDPMEFIFRQHEFLLLSEGEVCIWRCQEIPIPMPDTEHVLTPVPDYDDAELKRTLSGNWRFGELQSGESIVLVFLHGDKKHNYTRVVEPVSNPYAEEPVGNPYAEESVR